MNYKVSFEHKLTIDFQGDIKKYKETIEVKKIFRDECPTRNPQAEKE
jgi:hypothetical protein